MLSPMELQKFEAPLIALANLSGGDLRKLFFAFFSFLNRRTDFYCISPSDGSNAGVSNMGFQEGQAEKILLASFRRFPLRRAGLQPSPGGAAAGTPAAVVKQSRVSKDAPKMALPKTVKKSCVASAEEPKPKIKNGGSSNIDANKNDSNADESVKPAARDKTEKPKSDTIRYTEDGKQIPIGNGGSTSRYVWTQTLEEVTVYIPLPEGLRAKDLDVKIAANSLSIGQKGDLPSGSALIAPIEGTLFAKIRQAESTWTLESTTHHSQKVTTLQLILEKVQKTWWATVLSGDTPLIDTTMVDSTRHICTYDDETQAQIRRILFDQRQERLGLQTSQQAMLQNLPPMPNGEKFEGAVSLPGGVEYIDGETLDKASISNK